MKDKVIRLSFYLAIALISACTTINVDQVRLEQTVDLVGGDAIAVLGRHQTAEIQTEASLVSCIGRKLGRATGDVTIIPEKVFVDTFFPWFEPRTAPLSPARLRSVLDQPLLAKKIQEMNLKYLVWVEGSTERTDSAGSMTCTIGPGGGGCFGFGTWEDTSDYETTIWNLDSFTEVGRISTEAVGTSYMPAFFVPIPLLARVEGDACQGMANQLIRFFAKDDVGLKKISR